jgi:hypothetical protein
MQEAWSALLALTVIADSQVQESLYGIALLSTLHALSPPAGHGVNTAGLSKAAHTVVTSALQSATLSPLMQRVVPRLSVEEKGRLREGLRHADKLGPGGLGCAHHGSSGPQINFAAFHA